MRRNCIPPTSRAWCRNLWIAKRGALARFIAHFCPDITRRKGVHLCQSVRFAGLFSIARPFWYISQKDGHCCFASCIFFIMYWTPLPPACGPLHHVSPPLVYPANISKYGQHAAYHKMIDESPRISQNIKNKFSEIFGIHRNTKSSAQKLQNLYTIC